ncbi:MAG: hypothetical protein J5829_06845 [Lachnospiraceae bacterium]|nr:hypothetical protein [Lachnospiraceae bacterium]
MDHFEIKKGLEKVTGGEGSGNSLNGELKCPKCGCTDISVERPDPLLTIYRCRECGYEWDE